MTESSEQYPVTVLQTVAVTGAVTITPKIECGPLTVTCLEGKIIKGAHSFPDHNGQVSCRLLLVQELCVEVPVTFSANATCEVDQVHCGSAEAVVDDFPGDHSGSSDGERCRDWSGEASGSKADSSECCSESHGDQSGSELEASYSDQSDRGDEQSHGDQSDSADEESYSDQSDSADEESYSDHSDSADEESSGDQSDSADEESSGDQSDSDDEESSGDQSDSDDEDTSGDETGLDCYGDQSGKHRQAGRKPKGRGD